MSGSRPTPTSLPPELVQALEHILAYLDDERADFVVNPSDDHIYASVRLVQAWLRLDAQRHGPQTATQKEPELSAEVNAPDFFGGCPECGRNDGYLNVGPNHWFFCETHKVKWLRGTNLFSSHRHQTKDDWDYAIEKLRDYAIVLRLFCEPHHDPELEP